MCRRMSEPRSTVCWMAVVAILFATPLPTQADLPNDFQTPPESARPWVYWFWMNGNITREGITADLEAMHDVGIGGCLIMHVKLGDIGQHKLGQMPPDGPIRFMSDEFCDLFRYAVAEADRLGMQIDMNNADGFTGSGGPWVPVEKSMKKLVWTETQLKGGREVSQELAQPETVLNFYRDVAVIAFPRQHSLYDQMEAAQPAFFAPAENFNSKAVADGDPQTRALIWKQGQPIGPVLRISFDKPYTADTLVLHGLNIGRGRPTATLEVSDDGKTYRQAGDMCLKWYPAAPTNTARFDACRGRHFRIRFAGNCPQVGIGDVELGLSNKVHYWEPKSGYGRYGEWGAGSPLYTDKKMTSVATPSTKSSPVSKDGTPAIPSARVLNLSDSMEEDGTLSWNAPEGDWTILRIGYTSTGTKNHPASEGGHGLECDKLHPSGVEAAFAGMLQRLIDTSDEYVGRSFSHAHIDSWEVGIQNWTQGMANTFQERNGYDLTPFYPLLVAGHAVESNEASERFLWDLRQTLLAMMAKNYLGRVTELCHENGLKFSSEAGGRQTFLHNPVALLAISDLPMGEFWPHEGTPRVDGKAAASVAHIYGKPIAGAESFTGAGPFATWRSHPYRLKQIGDEAFCLGINHFVIHYYVHQAYEGFRPGFAMGPWGIHLDRMNTWWQQSEPWFDYLARCQHMLRQGQFVADVLYFPGEGAPHYFGKRPSLTVPLPAGYDYDGCDRETLLHRLSIEDGRLVVPSGMSYRYLMLADDQTMTPELAHRVRELVEAGAKVIGPKPIESPSLQDHPQCDEEVREIADALWGSDRVISGKTFEEIAEADGISADFAFSSPAEKAKLHYIHRRLPDADLYFVANGNDEAVDAVATFRVADRRPEIWDPQTGEISMPAVFENLGDRIRLPLHLDRLQSIFVVYRAPLPKDSMVRVTARPTSPLAEDAAPPIVLTKQEGDQVRAEIFCNGRFDLEYSSGARQSLEVADVPAARELRGPWKVHFPAGWDAPEQVEFDELSSWAEHENPGVKYFSGTATYRMVFDGPAESEMAGSQWFLDLGDVQVIAQVRLNGRDQGTYWKPPFRVDLSETLKVGQNNLEIQVTNLWPNRLIGDEQLPDDAQWEGPYLRSWPKWFLDHAPRPEPRRKAFAVVKHYNKQSPLLPSGLLGPVTLKAARVVSVPRVP
jgi:(4-O-methyl)-D-glucuronate---lignin esterase